MKQKIYDSFIYISARYGAFVLASIISALFNIFLFQSLDPSWRILLIGMSIALEGAKLTTILSYNVMKAMFLKLNVESLKQKARALLAFYFVYGVLSMIASLGFSTVVTSKKAAMEDYRVVTMEEKIAQVEDIRQRINDYETMKDVSLSNYRPYDELQSKIQEASDFEQERRLIYIEADDRETRLGASTRNGQLTEGDGQGWSSRNAEYAAARQEMIGFRNQYNAARDEKLKLEANLHRVANEHGEGATRADERIADLLLQFNVLRESFDLKEGISPAAAITQLRENKGKIESEILQAKGMAYMFDKFSEFTDGRASPTAIMFGILMLISILLEITIYQCSPDIRVDRRVLRYFRRSLPRDRTIEEIVGLFDSDVAMFEYVEERQKPVEIVRNKPARPARRKPASVVVSLDRDGGVEEAPLFMESTTVKNSDLGERPLDETNTVPTPTIAGFQIDDESDEPFVIDAEIGKLDDEETKKVVITKSAEYPVSRIKSNPIEKESDGITTTQLAADLEFPEKSLPVDQRKRKVAGRSEYIAEEINDGSSNAKERYRFATTTPFVVSKFSEFIEKCVGLKSGTFAHDPIEVAKDMKLNANSREVFLGRLTRLMSGGKPLVERDEDGGYRSNFGKQEIIDYVSQKV